MLETLRADDDFALLRQNGCLVLAAASARAELARRLAHEHALRDALDPSWAARPIALDDAGGRPVLRLDDPGGERLASRVAAPWETSAFVRAAIGLAAALRGVHARGLIHKAVMPANVLLDLATGHAWLTGFGIAARAPRERNTSLDDLPRTLTYIAPEQTGRMNRSVDSRSDLYGLGATLAPLSRVHVDQLVANALRCRLDDARALAAVVHDKTDGNPLFVAQFLAALADEGLIAFDAEAVAWRWDLHRIESIIESSVRLPTPHGCRRSTRPSGLTTWLRSRRMRRLEYRVGVGPAPADHDVLAELDSSGIRAGMGLPLRIGGEVIAALTVDWVRPGERADEHVVQPLRQLADVFANALARRGAALELERSAAALDVAQRELAHITRVTTLGELTASIAHEINQPLSAIVTNATACMNWLAREQPDLARARDTLADLSRDGERAAEVLTRIRALLSRASLPMAPCDVAQVVGGVVPLLRGQLDRDHVVLATRFAPALPRVHGDPVQLQQVILNLVLNAAEASREVAIERRRVVVRGEVERDGVVIAVEDAGVGFGALNASRLFDTFFTTKATGLGMGLSISRSIVERHGGRLWAEANLRHGATFRFALPAMV